MKDTKATSSKRKPMVTHTILFYFQSEDGSVKKLQRDVKYFKAKNGGPDRLFNQLFDMNKESDEAGLASKEVVARSIVILESHSFPCEASVYKKRSGGTFRKMGQTKLPAWVTGTEYEAELAKAWQAGRFY